MSRKPEEGEERRRAPRVTTEGRLAGEIPVDLDGDVRQLSVAGMMLESDRSLEVGSRHRFTLILGDTRIEVDGIVRNSEPAADRRVFRVGVAFVDLDASRQERIERYVAERLQS